MSARITGTVPARGRYSRHFFVEWGCRKWPALLLACVIGTAAAPACGNRSNSREDPSVSSLAPAASPSGSAADETLAPETSGEPDLAAPLAATQPVRPAPPNPAPSGPAAPPGSQRDSARIFFIGHSLVNHDLPRMVNILARSAGRDVEVGHQVINGAPLRVGWDESAGAEGSSARAVLPRGRFDVLVMTEAIPLADHLEWNEPARYAGNFVDLARQANANLTTYIYETWHSRNDRRWRRRIDTDRAGWESIADGIMASRRGVQVHIVPAGSALAALHDRIAAGSVPGLRRTDELFADDIHLNDRGNYFVALVHYATIFRRSPVGLTTVIPREYEGRYGTPSAETARAMQEIAWQAVQASPRSGVSAP